MRSLGDPKFLGRWITFGGTNFQYLKYFCAGESNNYVYVFYHNNLFCYPKSSVTGFSDDYHGLESDPEYFPSKDAINYNVFDPPNVIERVKWYKK